MKAKDLDVQVKLVIVPPSAVPFGPALGKGVVELCRRVDGFGSLNKAAKDMGMSYSKAWRIMKGAEEGFGFELLLRNGPKGSVLTEDARKLVEAYGRAEQAASDAARASLVESLS